MRSIYSTIPVLIALVFVFSACSENLHSPITKRQHRKGINIDFAHKAKPAPAVEAAPLEAQREKTSHAPEVSANPTSAPMLASTETDVAQLVKQQQSTKTYETPFVAKKSTVIKSVVSKVKKPFVKMNQVLSDSDNEDDARSLIWLIIIILLVLWLLGFLAGGLEFGGLIHLLLLIALILFILWLFKII